MAKKTHNPPLEFIIDEIKKKVIRNGKTIVSEEMVRRMLDSLIVTGNDLSWHERMRMRPGKKLAEICKKNNLTSRYSPETNSYIFYPSPHA